MLTTPQTITINTVGTLVHKVAEDQTSSRYKSDDDTLSFVVSHQESKKRTRRMVRIDKTIIATDPLDSVNAYQKAGVYIVIDEPAFGFSDADLTYYVAALTEWLNTAGNISAVLSGRH